MEAGRIVGIGSSRLDLTRGILSREGQPVPVRAKTFALIAFLARSRGRVLSKDAIIGEVWSGLSVSDDTLTQTIKDVRRALGPADATLLQTVPRRGYLLAEDHAAAPLAVEPRIGVLPFAHEVEADHRSLVEGLAEEIAYGLARFRSLAVVSPYSALRHGGEVEAAITSFGLDYAVTGHARSAHGGLLLSVALSAPGNRNIWGDRIACEPSDLPRLAHDLPTRLILRLLANIETAEMARPAPAPPDKEAFHHFVLGLSRLRSFGPGVNEEARDHFRSAIAADPDYGLAHAYETMADAIIHGYGSAPDAIRRHILDRALRATMLSPEEARCHRIHGLLRLLLARDHDGADGAILRALDLNPYDADGLAYRSLVLTLRGRPREALALLTRAADLNPLHPDWYNNQWFHAHYQNGQYDGAAADLARLPRLKPFQRMRLAAALAMAGREAEAARELLRARAEGPDLDFAREISETLAYERQADLDHVLEGLRRAEAAVLRVGKQR